MELTIWDYSNIVSKWLIYIGVASAIGGPFIAALLKSASKMKPLVEYVLLGSLIGFIAVIINFFIQVGAFSETGLIGMFDADMIELLWQSPVGNSVLWRLLGFAISALALLLLMPSFLHKQQSHFLKMKRAGLYSLYFSAVFTLAYSFTFVGHNADIGGIAKWLISLHIVTMGWWIGALYPLWLCCQMLEQKALYRLMHLFGRLAMAMVGFLVICGTVLLTLFLDSPTELIMTPYGQLILVKLIAVVAILFIAALHKYRLVPSLEQGEADKKLSKSIAIEMIVACVILAITAVLSTVTGPVNLG